MRATKLLFSRPLFFIVRLRTTSLLVSYEYGNKKEHTTYVICSINFICKDPRGSEGITEQSDVIVAPRGSEGIRFAKQNSGVFQSKTMKKSQNI